MKKLALFITLFSLIFVFGLCSCGEKPTEGLRYNLLPDKTYEVSIGEATEVEEIVIPSTYKGVAVTKIAEYGFAHQNNVKKVIVGEGITSIEKGAFFECSSLESIELPKSITEIKKLTFVECVSLSKIKIPNGVETIGASAFFQCTGLKKVSFPNTLKVIELSAFECCESLEKIELPSSLISIEGWAFCGCTSVKTVAISEGLECLGPSAFSDCTSIESITLPFVGITPSDGASFKHAFGDSVPESIKKVKILGGEIREVAFKGLKHIEKIELPSNVLGVSKSTFEGCTSLKYNEYKNGLYLGNKSNKYAVLVKAKNEDILSCKIAKGTEIICKEAFEGCTELESLKIKSNTVKIGERAFNGCRSLKEVYIPSSVQYIEEDVFNGCIRLTIHCELEEMPKGEGFLWSKDWNPLNRPVVWGE